MISQKVAVIILVIFFIVIALAFFESRRQFELGVAQQRQTLTEQAR